MSTYTSSPQTSANKRVLIVVCKSETMVGNYRPEFEYQMFILRAFVGQKLWKPWHQTNLEVYVLSLTMY